MVQFNDSLMGYFTNALESFDQTLNLPLQSVSYGRDLPIRTDVVVGTEATAFTRQTFGGTGTKDAKGLPVIAPNTTVLPGIDIDGEKVSTPFLQFGREISFTSIELQRSQMLGQPLDSTKFNALQSMYQMDADQMAYMGNGGSIKGLINNASVTAGNATAPAGAARTADEWLALFDSISNTLWTKSGFSVCPDTFLVPTAVFAALGGKLDNGSGLSIMQYVVNNALSSRLNGRPVNIQPLKWANKDVSGLAKDRIVAYTKDQRFVRFPLTALQRETPYYQGIAYISPYLWGMGGVEVVYTETISYTDL